MRAAAVVVQCGREIARLAGVENALRIEQPAPVGLERDSRARELLGQHRDVIAARVKAGQIRLAKKGQDFQRFVFEGRLGRDNLVGDAVDRGRFDRDRDARIQQPVAADLRAVRLDPDRGQLDDPVRARTDAGGFDVKHNQGAVKLNGKHDDKRGLGVVIQAGRRGSAQGGGRAPPGGANTVSKSTKTGRCGRTSPAAIAARSSDAVSGSYHQ